MKQVNQLNRSYIITFFLLLISVSCSNDEPKVTEVIENTDDKIEYYVKYQSNVSISSSYFIEIDIEVVTEKGKQALKVPRQWEGVFGPFNELTTLSITSHTTGWNTNTTNSKGSISICRGNQPFILKAEKYLQGTSYNVSYTVTKEDLK